MIVSARTNGSFANTSCRMPRNSHMLLMKTSATTSSAPVRAHGRKLAGQPDFCPAVPLNEMLTTLPDRRVSLRSPPRADFAVIPVAEFVADPVARHGAECTDSEGHPPVQRASAN